MSEFHFSLPRLLAKWVGQSVKRTESNWLEANVVGGFAYLIAYVFAFQLLLAGLPVKPRLLLLFPLAPAVGVFWLIALFLNSFIIRLARRCGLLKTVPDSRPQSFAICTLTTVVAWHLTLAGSWPRLIGILWMGAVALNLFAALLLALSDGVHVSAK